MQTAKPKPKTGRPSKFVPEAAAVVLAHVRRGAPRHIAASAAGLGRSTLMRWMARGKKERRAQFRDFWDGLKKAEAELVIELVDRINTAAEKGTWQAAAWTLERRHPEGLQPLIGKTVGMVSDARMSNRADTATIVERLLSISGEDAQTIDRKHLSPVTVKLPTRFILATNEMPRLNDASGALAGRFVVLALTQSFYGREDHSMADKLIRELPSILLWAVEGWKRLQAWKRFTVPKSGETIARTLDDLNSPIGQFVRDRCIIAAELTVSKAEIYTEWKSWGEESGHVHGSDSHFARNLLACVAGRGPSKERPEPSTHRVHAEPHEKQGPSKQSNQKYTSYVREGEVTEGEVGRKEVVDAIGDLPGQGGRGLADDTDYSAIFH